MEDEDEEFMYTGVVKKLSAKDLTKYIIDCKEALDVYEVEPRMPVDMKPQNVEIGDTIRFTLDEDEPVTTWVEKVLKKRKADKAVAAEEDDEEAEQYIGTVTKQSVKVPTLYLVDCPVVTEWYKTEARLPEKLWPDGLELGGSIRFTIKETSAGKPLVNWAVVEEAAPEKKKAAAPAKTTVAAKTSKTPPAKKAKAAPGLTAEVRMEDAESAAAALELDGSELNGATITVVQHPSSDDGRKVQITGITPGTRWTALKDLFKTAGSVAFAKIFDDEGGGKGGGGGGRGGGGGDGAKTSIGEVRFHDSASAEASLALYGSVCQGNELRVELDGRSSDGTKVRVFGLPAGFSKAALKEHFEEIAEVAFCRVHDFNK